MNAADDARAGGPARRGTEPATTDLAAATALARVRQAARDAGLVPGRAPRPRRRRPTEAAYSSSREDARDPLLLGDQVERLVVDRNWDVDVSVGAVMGRWPAVVGPDVARHCSPVTFENGSLVVRADSSSWATQLRYMTSSLLGRLEAEVGPGVVTAITVVGPSTPSWRRGPRRAPGPGPRDTYG